MRMSAAKKSMKKNLAGYLFVLPGLSGVLLFYLIPFGDMVRRSFCQAMGGFCGFENYKTVWNNEAFRLAAANTVRFTLVCLPLLLLISLAVALLLQGAGRLLEVFKSIYLVPMAIPAASMVLCWKLLFDAHGIVNGVLDRFFGISYDWMNTDKAFYVLVGSYIWKNLGYVVILWLAAMAGVPTSIYEAARVDGAGWRQCFFSITLPCIRPAAFTIVVISFLNSFKAFREAYLVAGNYPQESIYLLQHLFNNWFLSLSVDKMAAGAVMLAIIISLIVQALMWLWERK